MNLKINAMEEILDRLLCIPVVILLFLFSLTIVVPLTYWVLTGESFAEFIIDYIASVDKHNK